MDCLAQLQLACRQLKIGLHVLNLETELFEIKEHLEKNNLRSEIPHMIIFPSMKFLAAVRSKQLKRYMEQGGILVIYGEIPEFDENYQPCLMLKEIFQRRQIRKRDFARWGKGFLIYQRNNPFQQPRKIGYYITYLLTRILMIIKLRIPHIGLIEGRSLPFTEIFSIIGPALFEGIGGDIYSATLSHVALQTITQLVRILQHFNITRDVELQIRTNYKYRRNVDVFVYHHPSEDVQYVFIFSLQCATSLPVILHYYLPEKRRRIVIKTILVGQTAQLLRIKDGQIDSFIYTGVNPVSRQAEPLSIKMNNTNIYTTKPVDVILIRKPDIIDVYFAHGKNNDNNQLFGIISEPITIKNGDFSVNKIDGQVNKRV